MQVQQLYPANFFRFCLSSVDCLPATLQEKDQKTEAKIKDWLINVQSYSVVTAAIIVFFYYIYIYVLCWQVNIGILEAYFMSVVI